MLASTGMKSWLAYKTLRKLNTRSVSSPSSQDSLIASSTLSKVTTPPSVAAATGAAYTLSKLTNTPKLQRFLLKSTLSASAAGLLNAGLKRLIGRKRPRADSGTEFKGPALKDKFNAMPSAMPLPQRRQQAVYLARQAHCYWRQPQAQLPPR